MTAEQTSERMEEGAPQFLRIQGSGLEALLDKGPIFSFCTGPAAPPLGESAVRLGHGPGRPLLGSLILKPG